MGNRRIQWSFRLAEELRHSLSASFITLTYNDLKIPKTKAGINQLDKKDFQKFIKRLRKKINVKIRYYAVGEYGTKTNRPHYHAIIFNGGIHLNKDIQTCWQDREKIPYGNVHCGDVNGASIHYITKYHVNYTSKKDWILPINPEFSVMSKNPGIGHQYVTRAGEWNRKNKNLYVVNNGFKQALPRYYKEKVFTPIQRQLLSLEALHEADTAYISEVKRLHKQKYQNPTLEIELREIKKAQSIHKKAKAEGKL